MPVRPELGRVGDHVSRLRRAGGFGLVQAQIVERDGVEGGAGVEQLQLGVAAHEVLDLDALEAGEGLSDSSGTAVTAEDLQGEGALIAAMSSARDGRMGDIVATIQAEQDRVVTSSGRGVLVVQGGPGTGKTAVALHRVAYLFYSERERLERSGVLGECGPKLNEPRDPQYWFDQPGAPKPKLANEKPKGETIAYDELLKSWEQARN